MSRGALIRDSMVYAASQYLARAILVARGLAAAVVLGPYGYGGWNALNLIFDYGGYAGGGALQGLDLELPAAVRRGDAGAARRLMAAAWAALTAGGGLYAAALVIYLAAGGGAFSVWPGPGLPLLMLAAALLQLAFQYLASVLRAYGRFQAVSLGAALQAVVGGGLGLALVWRYGAWGLLAGWLAGTLLALGWMRRRAPEAAWRPSRPGAGLAMVRAGLPIFGFFAATLLLRSADRLALVHFGHPEALGYYGLGLMVAGLVLYLPESAAYVMFPRLAAAAQGAGDPERARGEAARAHRALTVTLPLVVGLGMVWAAPAVARLLPAYRPGVPVLRLLAIGAMMLAAATVPSYYLLAGRGRARLLAVGATVALLNAALVFTVAARDPRPVAIAVAATLGHTVFAVTLVARVGRDWYDGWRGRAGHLAASLLPAVWAGAVALAACAVGPAESWLAAALRSAVVAGAYAPVLLGLGRGAGLRELLGAWRTR